MINDEQTYQRFRLTIRERVKALAVESMLSEPLSPGFELRILPHRGFTGRIWYRIVVVDTTPDGRPTLPAKHDAYTPAAVARRACELARKFGRDRKVTP